MSGIYIHIPFCKQACNYCDFHFSTSLKKKDEMIDAIKKEMTLRKSEAAGQEIQTIYFGGGTPSILSPEELADIIRSIYQNYNVSKDPEITLEANPDDLFENSHEKFKAYKTIGINRLSIGIQSFFEDDLQMMNRAHNAQEAQNCLEIATQYFDNISIDLIYGIPGMSNQKWKQNIEKALSFGIPHISSYALTVEPKTALSKLIQTGKIANPNEEVAQGHFQILVETLENNGFIHYELSNFAKANFFSQNNSSYWLGKKYIGIGPSAHSYNGNSRSWNIANNSIYIKKITEDQLPSVIEILTNEDRYNEYVMTGLRTIWGISLDRIEDEFGKDYLNYLLKSAQKFIDQELLSLENQVLKTTLKGKFLTDGIASDLFKIN